MTAGCRVADGGTAAAPPARFDVEASAIHPQTLVPGVVPIMPLDRLSARAVAPLEPRKLQRPCDLVVGGRDHSG